MNAMWQDECLTDRFTNAVPVKKYDIIYFQTELLTFKRFSSVFLLCLSVVSCKIDINQLHFIQEPRGLYTVLNCDASNTFRVVYLEQRFQKSSHGPI